MVIPIYTHTRTHSAHINKYTQANIHTHTPKLIPAKRDQLYKTSASKTNAEHQLGHSTQAVWDDHNIIPKVETQPKRLYRVMF